MRDYGQDTQTIWDGDPKCEHKWGKEITRKQSGGTRISSVTNNSDDRIHFVSKSNFCSKCGGWKGQLGLEPALNLYIKHLCDIFDEVKRVLKRTGTVWVNLGDTYSGSGCGTNDYRTEASRSIQGKGKNAGLYKTGGIAQKIKEVPAKSLCLIPFRFATEMINRGWIMRNLIVWQKPNCIPSSAKDRFTVDFDLIMFFVKNRKYFFEQQFEGYNGPINRWGGQKIKSNTEKQENYFEMQKISQSSALREGGDCRPNPLGRNKRCVWRIPTQPFPEAHFAIYPEDLVETPINAGCPELVCKKCGQHRERIYEYEFIPQQDVSSEKNRRGINGKGLDKSNRWQGFPRGTSIPKFKGYSYCGCKEGFEPGIVLDPFCGSGTTCVVAKRRGRRWIGIDINPGYCVMARKRVAQIL